MEDNTTLWLCDICWALDNFPTSDLSKGFYCEDCRPEEGDR